MELIGVVVYVVRYWAELVVLEGVGAGFVPLNGGLTSTIWDRRIGGWPRMV